MENIIFYNPCRNGDIHISRNFVKYLCDALGKNKYNYIYSHKNCKNLLQDIDYLKYDNQLFSKISVGDFLKKEKNNIYINTWYAARNRQYINKYKITFDCLYFLFKDIFSFFNLKIEKSVPNLFNLFPSIDYNKYDTLNIKNFFDNNQNKPILICNGAVHSNQSYNLNLNSVVLELATQFKNKNFILTNNFEIDKSIYPNVYFTSDIINKKTGSDLNEISYLSLKCDLIIGKASGPFTFAMVQENLNNTNKKMISFSRLYMADSNSFFLHDWGKKNIKYKAQIIQPPQASHADAVNLIKKYLL